MYVSLRFKKCLHFFFFCAKKTQPNAEQLRASIMHNVEYATAHGLPPSLRFPPSFFEKSEYEQSRTINMYNNYCKLFELELAVDTSKFDVAYVDLEKPVPTRPPPARLPLLPPLLPPHLLDVPENGDVGTRKRDRPRREAFTLSLSRIERGAAFECNHSEEAGSDDGHSGGGGGEGDYKDCDDDDDDDDDDDVEMQAPLKQPRSNDKRTNVNSAEAAAEKRQLLRDAAKMVKAEQKKLRIEQKALKLECAEATKQLRIVKEQAVVKSWEHLPAAQWIDQSPKFKCTYADIPLCLRTHLLPHMTALRKNVYDPPQYKFVYDMPNGTFNTQFTSSGGKSNDVQLGTFRCPKTAALAVTAAKLDVRLRSKSAVRMWLAWMCAGGSGALQAWTQQLEQVNNMTATAAAAVERNNTYDDDVDDALPGGGMKEGPHAQAQRKPHQEHWKVYSEREINQILNCTEASDGDAELPTESELNVCVSTLLSMHVELSPFAASSY